MLDDPQAYEGMSRVENPYGDGLASRRIAARLVPGEAGAVWSVPLFVAPSPIKERETKSAEIMQPAAIC
jgi:hypothetical protein